MRLTTRQPNFVYPISEREWEREHPEDEQTYQDYIRKIGEGGDIPCLHPDQPESPPVTRF
jgi:hypothetical protein